MPAPLVSVLSFRAGPFPFRSRSGDRAVQARELMQLFTIGLWELEMDGSQKKDSKGLPIGTYNNDDIMAFSRSDKQAFLE